VCAALSDSVRRKILIPARVPFSDFYSFVLSFNFGAAAAACCAGRVHTGCHCVRASPGNFSLFIFIWLLADLARWLARHDTEKVFAFACLFLRSARLQPVPSDIYVLITTSLGCHFEGS
jgi:hypothetical protein